MNLNAPESLNELPTQFILDGRRYVLRAMPQPRVATRAVGVFNADSTQPHTPPVFVKWATGALDIALLRWEWTMLVERLPADAPVLRPLGWVEAGAYSGLVLPYQDGPTIERALRSRSLSLGEIMGLTAALCEAVAPLAAQGWQHHDLKPENLLITAEGLILVDLESAMSALEAPPGGPRTSPRYQPPEREFGLTRDVYSIGVMLMDLLALRLGRSFAITSVGLWEALDMAMASHTDSDGATLDLLARTLDRDPNRRPTCRALGEAAASLRDALGGPRGAALMERLAPGLSERASARSSERASTRDQPRPPSLWTQNPLLTDLPGTRRIGAFKVAETVLIPLLPLTALLFFCVVSAVFGVMLDHSLWSLLGLSLAVPVICNAVQRAKEASQIGEEGGWLSPQAEPNVWGRLAERSSPDRFIAVAIGLCFGIATAFASTSRATPELLQGILLAWGQALVSWLCLKPLRVLALINETFAQAPARWLWADERRRRLVTVFVRRLLASMVLAQAATLAWALVNLWPLQAAPLSTSGRLLLLLWGGFVLSVGLGPLLFTMAGFRLYLHRLEDELHNPGPSTARFNFVSRREWWSLALAQAVVVMVMVWRMTDPAVAVEISSSADQPPKSAPACSCDPGEASSSPRPVAEPNTAPAAVERRSLSEAPTPEPTGEERDPSPPPPAGPGAETAEDVGHLEGDEDRADSDQEDEAQPFDPVLPDSPPPADGQTSDGLPLARGLGRLIDASVDLAKTLIVTIKSERWDRPASQRRQERRSPTCPDGD